MIITRPKLTAYQKDIIYSPARFTVTEASTKAGKTFSHLWWLFEKACSPPKIGANYWWVAPVYAQAKIAFTRLKRVIRGNSKFHVNESELTITTPTGGIIWFKSAEKPDNLYGEDVYGAVFDEFTRAREEAWFALRSTLTATKGPCKFIGNVRGKKNWGYKLATKARSGDDQYQHFKITAYDAVQAGVLDAEEVDQAQKDLPESVFKQLYLAEALDDVANPFGVESLQRLIRPISDEAPVCFGVDLAKSVDWTVVTGLDEYGQICVFERWQASWDMTTNRIQQIVGSVPTLIDSTGVGDPIVESLQRQLPNIEGYHFTGPSKQKIMEGLASAIQKQEISILGGVMYDELESFEYEYTRTGVRYSAPEGMHDDCVCSLALANHHRIMTPRSFSDGEYAIKSY